MTELIQGSRFLDLVADEFDDATEYTPRHLRAVPLSPELQQALDAAFAPEPLPSHTRPAETVPVPEPTPGPTPVEASFIAPEAEPDRDVEPFHLTLVVPETIEYAPVLPESIFRTEATVPTPAEPAAVEPAVIAPVVAATFPAEPAARTTAPELASVTSFPDPGSYAARRASDAGVARPAPSRSSRLFRRKVDASRLVVPSA